jgi:glutathione synthase
MAIGGVHWPPEIADGEAESLVVATKDFSIGNGLSIRPPPAVISLEADPTGITAINAPVTLFPSPFPKKCFEQARSVQKTYNRLYAAISRDEGFLAEAVRE